MSIHAKNCVCRSNGLACGQYKEEKTPKKTLKSPKNVKSGNFKKQIFPIVIKNVFSKKIGCWVENCDL